MHRRPLFFVGNPKNRRTALFQRALAEAGHPAGRVVAYEDLLDRRTTLADHLLPETIVRIESPEKNFAVEKGLLRNGIQAVESEDSHILSEREIECLTLDRGLIIR